MGCTTAVKRVKKKSKTENTRKRGGDKKHKEPGRAKLQKKSEVGSDGDMISTTLCLTTLETKQRNCRRKWMLLETKDIRNAPMDCLCVCGLFMDYLFRSNTEHNSMGRCPRAF